MKKLLIYTFLFLSVAWAGKGIFKYSVYSTHDGNHHLARSFDAIHTISEGHFPLRWAGSLNYNCGAPIYNFFYPLIYYLVIVINFIIHDVILSLKVINWLSLFVGTIFFYLWIKSETKKEIPALGGAILYLYAPYRFLLIFVRGSPEFLAYAILPVVLYLYSVFFETKGKKSLFIAFIAALAGGLLTISHNFTVMFLMPLILLYLSVKSKVMKIDKQKILVLIVSYVSSLGFGAFFIGPAVLEKKFTKIGQSFLMWRDHFPTLEQLIKSKWDYFYSSAGTANDGMSFMLGYAHWAVLGIALLFVLYRLFKKKIDLWVILFFVGSLVTIYLILPWSIPVWEKLPPLQEIQFSWRLLGIAVFTISALFAFILEKIESKSILILLFVGVSFLAYFGNRNHLLPQPVSVEDIFRYDDFEKLHPHRYSTTTLGDDVLSKNAEKSCYFTTPIVESDKGEKISNNIIERKNTYGSLKLLFDKKESKAERIVLGLGYFPDIYHIFINGKELASYSDCGGRVCFGIDNLRDGKNLISWKITQSPIQNIFNYISLGFLLLWLATFSRKKWILVLGIFAIFAFFRFYNLDHRVGFGWDHERDAWAVKAILSGDIKLIGPRVLGPEGFFLPPYFFYLLTPFYLISNLHPNAIIYFLIFYNIGFFVISFFVLKKVFNEKISLIFLSLWAVNPLAISIDSVGWNPNLIPLVFMLLLYTAFKKHTFLSGILLGIGTSFHFQFLLLSPVLTPLALGKGFPKGVLRIVLGFFLPFIPLAIFDLKNNFLNLRLVGSFLTGGERLISLNFWNIWNRVSSFAFGVDVFPGVGIILYGVVLVLLSKLVKNKGLLLVWLTFPIIFTLYGKRPSEYYFNYLLPIVILSFSFLFVRLVAKSRYWILAVITTYIFWAIRAFPLTNSNNLSLYYKNETAFTLSKIVKNGSPFNISYDAPFNEDAGFRYLFNFYKIPGSGRDEDPLFEVVIPKHKRNDLFFTSGLIGVHIPKGWLDGNWVEKEK